MGRPFYCFKGHSTVFVDFSCFDFKDVLRFMYDMVQVIDFCLLPGDVLFVYLDECSMKTLDSVDRCFLSNFWEMFVDELCNVFVDCGSGWSRSTRKALAMTEDVAMMEDCLKDDAETVWETWHICR